MRVVCAWVPGYVDVDSVCVHAFLFAHLDPSFFESCTECHVFALPRARLPMMARRYAWPVPTCNHSSCVAGGGKRRLPKSRYESISSYICNCKAGADDTSATTKYNDIDCPVDEAALATLLAAGSGRPPAALYLLHPLHHPPPRHCASPLALRPAPPLGVATPGTCHS